MNIPAAVGALGHGSNLKLSKPEPCGFFKAVTSCTRSGIVDRYDEKKGNPYTSKGLGRTKVIYVFEQCC